MTKQLKLLIGGIAIIIAASLIGWWVTRDGELGAIQNGSATVNFPFFTTSTLTSSYTGGGAVSSSRIAVSGFPNLVLAGSYVPASYGSRIYILLERSVDQGQTFFPYMTVTPESGDVLVNSNGTSTTNGTPFVVPGNEIGTAASGTAIGFSFDMTAAADFIRVKVKETTTSTAGTLYMKGMATTN